MTKIRFAVVSMAGITLLLLAGSVAQAQVKRAWVKSTGVDTGNATCSFTSPCRTFQRAHDIAVGQSEVDAIDSADLAMLEATFRKSQPLVPWSFSIRLHLMAPETWWF